MVVDGNLNIEQKIFFQIYHKLVVEVKTLRLLELHSL